MSHELDDECFTCIEEAGEPNECPGSKRPCGHHCNHIWDQDACCWCTAHINDEGELVFAAAVMQAEQERK